MSRHHPEIDRVRALRQALSPRESTQSQTQSRPSPARPRPQPRINPGDSGGLARAAVRAVDHESPALPPLVTLATVAKHCLVSLRTVRVWVDAGKLPVLRLPGRLVRVRRADLERFLEECAP